ncbi:flagellar protein FliT [Massilia sp. W12]|uniref:flagellar protein FliT n=1 Tax=Massilia sp. W12 TaxID=3126507 RepID=UPI0030CF1317
MNSQEIITLYELVSDITGKMLAAARAGEWDRLTQLEELCSTHVQTLRNGEPPEPLSGPLRARKVQIIHKILADDREIRNLTEPWMAKLASLINHTGMERKLTNAYRTG